MSRPPNPITQGIKAVWRDPALFLVEILWRWSFIIAACLLIVSVGAILLGPLHVGNAWESASRSRDPQRMGQLLLGVALLLGARTIMIAALVVPLAIALLWSIFSTLGRFVTVRRLRAGLTSLRFRSLLALQVLRGFISWFTLILLASAILGETLIATRGPQPDLVLFYVMMTPTVVLIAAFWLICNWYLSLAAIFGREEHTFRGAIREARQTVRLQRSDFAGTGFVFVLIRIALLLVVVAICGLTSGMAGTAPQNYFVLLMVVLLAYLAVAYFFYMSRMAAYLALAAARVEPGGPKLVTASSASPVENSTPL
jgi:hypothetical protein